MEKDLIYKRSIKALQKFIAETPADELATLISDCEKMEIEGPTFDEYLELLQIELEKTEWNPCLGKSISVNGKGVAMYMIEYSDDYYPPPRSKRNSTTNKKDSAIFAESFFSYNCIMIEAKSAAFKFKGYKIPSFSYDESGKVGSGLVLNFEPSGKYSQQDGVYELCLEMFGFEAENKDKKIIYLKCIAYFEFEIGLPIETLPSYFYKNAIAIMFPYIRSFASTLTLQANSTLLILGLMNLSNLEAPLIKNTISE